MTSPGRFLILFFSNDTSPPELYTLSLHDALPISGTLPPLQEPLLSPLSQLWEPLLHRPQCAVFEPRSEEHTSELQSRPHLVCRLLLEKKKKNHGPDLRAHILTKVYHAATGSRRCT